MVLKFLFLQNFRNHKKSEFSFSEKVNFVVGPNGIGKTNLLEAVSLLSTGKSFRADKDDQMIGLGTSVARVGGKVSSHKGTNFSLQGSSGVAEVSSHKGTSHFEASGEGEETGLEVVINSGGQGWQKRFSVNGVSRRRNVFAGMLKSVVFLPTDLEIVIGQPGVRRRFLDDVLEQVDAGYSLALMTYGKALRQRNALLARVQETGVREEKYFAYWDELLIGNGRIVAQRREEFIEFVNRRLKGLYGFGLVYDKSEISLERLEKYRQAEVGAGVTLVGPHRDDVLILNEGGAKDGLASVKSFASRGQQRLVVLELRLSQIAYIEERTGERPLLMLDDIFSELDDGHMKDVIRMLPDYQCIITTTHEEFLGGSSKVEGNVIELKKE